jgi:hypothetical protein
VFIHKPKDILTYICRLLELGGNGNIFLGPAAGWNSPESNRLYIDNSGFGPDSALIYGEFDNAVLKLNAWTHVRDALIQEPRKAPSAEEVIPGMIYFDVDENKLKVYDGTVWRALW